MSPATIPGRQIPGVVACVFLASSCWAGDQDPVYRDGVNLVLLDVGVTDSAGVPVAGLVAVHFQLRQNGRLQEVARFDTGSASVSLAVVADYSFSMRPRHCALLRGLRALLGELREEDDASLMIFNDGVETLVPFRTPFTPQLWSSRLQARIPAGRTSLYDAVLGASRSLESSRNERRVIVVLSDGEDSASAATLQQALDELKASNRLLYTVGLFNPGDPDTNAGALRKLADVTGGLALFDPDARHLSVTFASVMKDLRARYLLGFYSEDATSGKTEVRRLSVSARDAAGRKLRVKSRHEYRIGARN